jgi:ethanolamine utilization protein EutJ
MKPDIDKLAHSRREYLDSLSGALNARIKSDPRNLIRCGLDLGSASITLVVLSGDGSPLALARRQALGIREGLVVDFGAARSICKKLKSDIENDLGIRISKASIAMPPGTQRRDAATHRYVCEGADMEVDRILEKPQATNLFLGLKNGAFADLGGGTTQAAVFKDGKLIHSFNEPTGGRHLSLVIAGRYKLPLEQAENFKVMPDNAIAIAPLIAPVLSKMGRILKLGLEGLEVQSLLLAGGCALAPGAGPIIEKETSLPVEVAYKADLVAPLGIALGCEAYQPQLL